MMVTCGSEWQTSVGGRRNYSISLDLDDLREIKGEDVDRLTRQEALRELNKAADLLVIGYMLKENAITKDFAEQRIREIQGV